MKKINKLTLNHLSKTEMEKREMNILKGGDSCPCPSQCPDTCACLYEGEQGYNCVTADSYYGGSSTHDNNNANGGQEFQFYNVAMSQYTYNIVI